MKKLYFILTLLFFTACHSRNDAMLMELGAVTDDFEAIYDVPPANQSLIAAPEKIETTKKVVKTGTIDFESENIATDYKQISQLLPKYQAYIENENQKKSTYRINYTLTVRVPSQHYDSLFNAFSGLAFRIENKSSNVEDVTERYYDLKTRIKNKSALEQRYIELLKKASDIKDILAIEKNLNEVRTAIEQLQGQFNYLSKKISLSTINLSFYETLPYVHEGSGRKGFWARVLSATDDGWQGFLTFLVGLATLWPFLILLVGIIYVFRKWRKNRKNKKGSK